VTKKIEDAIDLALAVLEEHRNRVEDQNYDPYSSAFFHEELSVCSDVRDQHWNGKTPTSSSRRTVNWSPQCPAVAPESIGIAFTTTIRASTS
jgi:hypothetical protein